MFERRGEDLAVADLAGAGRLFDGFNDLIDQMVRHGGFDAQLGQEIDGVLGAAIQLGMALLAAKSLYFSDSQTLDAIPDRATRTSSSLKGLMMAMMSFMAFPLMVARWPHLSSKFHAMSDMAQRRRLVR